MVTKEQDFWHNFSKFLSLNYVPEIFKTFKSGNKADAKSLNAVVLINSQ